MSAHTPGPWTVNGFLGDFRVIARTCDGVAISAVAPGGDGISNARLIAAAPELLAACKQMVKATDPYKQKEALDYLYAVIDKAEGR